MMKRMIFFTVCFLLTACIQNPVQLNQIEPPSSSDQLEIKADFIHDNWKNQEENLNNKIKIKGHEKILLDIPIISQKPELKNGCEVTSLAMLLQFANIDANKLELAAKVKKESEPIVQKKEGDVAKWGNPNEGFVGDITGKRKGYAVYAKPMESLMEQYLPGRVINLSGKDFNQILNQVSEGKPVIIWTTSHFKEPRVWDFWVHRNQKIKATMEEHAVLLVGYDQKYVYVNDPLTGIKARRVNKQSFERAWISLGKQALSYK